MALIETEALILKSYNLADADKIVVFLTENEGLIRGVAKGAKRLKSKFGGTLEQFSIVQISYIQKEEQELVSVRQIELTKSFFKNANNPEFLQKFSYLVELLSNFAPPNEPNTRLYKMSKVCLEVGSKNEERLDAIGLYFEYWVLRLGGYLPDWHNCGNCRRNVSDSEATTLRIDFDILCLDCSKDLNNRGISSFSRQLFNSMERLSPKKFVEYTIDKTESMRDISSILKIIISRVLDREIVEQRSLRAEFPK